MRGIRSGTLCCAAVLVAFGTTACFGWDAYDPRLVEEGGSGAGGTGAAGGQGGSGATGGTGAQGGAAGSGGQAGGETGGTGGSGGSEPCEGTTFECSPDGTARVCDDGTWQELGVCALGCDVSARACRTPSNVPADWIDDGTAELTVSSGTTLALNTQSGEILSGTDVVRPAGQGLDAGSGIAFHVQSQGTDAPALGVFSFASLEVADGGVMRGTGSNALALLVDGNVQVNGWISVAASGITGGAGGHAGGAAGANGHGNCAGQVGQGTWPGTGNEVGCTSGSGGAGYGGVGGPGGACVCPDPDAVAGGLGGPATCGTDELVPLLGGSGGAGGTLPGAGPSVAGVGGGGGGALQISAAGSLTVGSTGRIDANGAGGAGTLGGTGAAGGAGGGSGGALLLEAPVVTVAVNGVLAANGGGGGAGDCN